MLECSSYQAIHVSLEIRALIANQEDHIDHLIHDIQQH